MATMGFEPMKLYVSDLKSDPFDRSGILPVTTMRFELMKHYIFIMY